MNMHKNARLTPSEAALDNTPPGHAARIMRPSAMSAGRAKSF